MTTTGSKLTKNYLFTMLIVTMVTIVTILIVTMVTRIIFFASLLPSTNPHRDKLVWDLPRGSAPPPPTFGALSPDDSHHFRRQYYPYDVATPCDTDEEEEERRTCFRTRYVQTPHN